MRNPCAAQAESLLGEGRPLELPSLDCSERYWTTLRCSGFELIFSRVERFRPDAPSQIGVHRDPSTGQRSLIAAANGNRQPDEPDAWSARVRVARVPPGWAGSSPLAFSKPSVGLPRSLWMAHNLSLIHI